MERMLKRFISGAAMLSLFAVQANNVTPTLVLRSQGFHNDRQKWVGEVGHIHLYDMESWYGTLDVAVGYMRSFREDRLARCLFGTDLNCNDCNPTIKVQGSQVSGRDSKAWLADYLYLPCDFDGSFSVEPRIQNVVVDLDFYLGLDEWVNGLYFRAYGPINWTKWQVNFSEGTSTVGTSTCAAGKFTPSGSETFLTDIASYFGGSAPAKSEGVTFNGLSYAKMASCKTSCNDETETGFADLRLILGWDFLQDEDYHLGAYIQTAAPTGNKRKAAYVMDPVVGNGNHWELGGGVNGHYVFWRSEDEEKHFGFYMDVSLSHLFEAKEQRTFDLAGKDNSRYMLAMKMKKNSSTDIPSMRVATNTGAASAANIATADAFVPSHVFASEFTPVANLTSMDVNVSIGVQADVVAMFNFTSRGFAWDLGYNFWGRTCEDIDCPASSCDPCNQISLCNSTLKDNLWALKGDARVFGYDSAAPAADPADEAIALSATDSAATIHNGSNSAQSGSVAQNNNYGVDTASFAYGNFANATSPFERLLSVPSSQGGLDNSTFHIKGSKTPVLLKCADVELTETRGLSHTVFTHISYTWDRDNWVPYLGIGGSAEFGKSKGCGDCGDSSSCSTSSCSTSCSTSCDTSCDSCVDCAISQWSVWVKGGLSFN